MNYLKGLYQNRNLIIQLAKNDFKVKYLGSYLGVFWAFVHPTLLIGIYWFVFQSVFKVNPLEGYPFILWLIAGLIPWFFITESVSNGTNALLDNVFLVKKIVFNIKVLPLIKVASSLFIHLFFIVVMLVIMYFYGYSLDLYSLQIFYYVIATIILVTGISYITSSLVPFFRDVSQIVSVFLQLGFWLTPIIWSFNILPLNLHIFFKLNPFYYIVEGYRSLFLYKRWFWEDPLLTLYFWIVTLLILTFGIKLFNKLKTHFPDVL